MTTLADIERRLALFTQGISNRLPAFHQGDESRQIIDISDGCDLYLPDEVKSFSNDASNDAVYLWKVLQQLAFRRYDTFSFKIEIARQKFPTLTETVHPVSHRAPDLELFFNHFDEPHLARFLFFIFEEARVACRLIGDFPGANRLRAQHQLHRIANMPANTHTVLLGLFELESSLQDPSSLTEFERALTGELFDSNATVYSSVLATINCYNEFVREKPAATELDTAQLSEDEIDLARLQRVARLEEWEDELRDIDAELASFAFADEGKDIMSAREEELQEGSIRDTSMTLEIERNQLKRRIDMERSLLSGYRRTANVDRPSFRYDEWDYINQAWLSSWCSVYEIREEHTSQDSLTELLQSIKPLVAQTRKQFEQLKPAGVSRTPGYLDGDELDLNAIVDMRADIRAGITPSERIYSRLEKNQRDISACFLVDLSASTDDPIKPAESELLEEDESDPFDDPYLHGAIDFDPEQAETETPRKIIDIQKEAVLLLSTALENLGDLYAIYGFSGYGRECVEIHIAKEFNEPLARKSMNAIAAMKPLRSTRMGPAIRHATSKLQATGSGLRVLMIISDGFPQDSDYGPERGDHEYGIQDTAKAIREASAKGIRVFCITVDISGHDYLRRMCDANQYLVIEEINELPNELQRTYTRLTS